MNAHTKATKTIKALELLSTMVHNKIKLDTITYNAAIQACERAGQWREAIRLFDAMQATGQGGGGARAARSLPGLADQAADVKRDSITYNAVVRACEKGAPSTAHGAPPLSDSSPPSTAAGLSRCLGGQFELAYDYMRASASFDSR